MKTARDQSAILTAYRDLGSYRAAAALCGTTHKTVRRVIERQEAPPMVRPARPRATDPYRDLIEQRVRDTGGRISAKRLLPQLKAARYPGSARTLRRAVATAKAEHRRSRRVYRPWQPVPGEHLAIDWGVIDGLHVFCAVLAWSRVRFVRFADREDQATTLRLLADSGATVAHCPWVFGRRGIAMESFARYLDAGVHMSLGTDTFPQSMLHEMRVAATLSKVVDRQTQVATAGDVFDAATLGGAYAIGRDDLGRLAPGAKADIVCYRTDSLSMSPVRDPLRSLVYSALPSDVALVVIDGRVVLRDGVIEGLDEAELALGLRAAAESLWRDLPNRDWRGRTIDEIAPQTYPAW